MEARPVLAQCQKARPKYGSYTVTLQEPENSALSVALVVTNLIVCDGELLLFIGLTELVNLYPSTPIASKIT